MLSKCSPDNGEEDMFNKSVTRTLLDCHVCERKIQISCLRSTHLKVYVCSFDRQNDLFIDLGQVSSLLSFTFTRCEQRDLFL